jgi:CBS domain-containing protein
MLVESALGGARKRLITISDSAPLIEAAKLFRAGTDLIVVCGRDDALVGIITKTDVVGQISHCQGASCTTAASSVMVRDVALCRPGEWLSDVWSRMKNADSRTFRSLMKRLARLVFSQRVMRSSFSCRSRRMRNHFCETTSCASGITKICQNPSA